MKSPLTMAVASLLMVTATQFLSGEPPARRDSETGFSLPFAGAEEFEDLAPTQATDPGQINQPIGRRRADQIARKLGLIKKLTLTEEQYVEFITGGGNSADLESAELADVSVRIFTNTVGRPLCYDSDPGPVCTVLASYGLFVNDAGQLMSLANLSAPTRKANELLAPTGYVNTWFVANGATRSLVQLYRSAYPEEAFFGALSQNLPSSDPAQLVINNKAGQITQVGMSMAPTIWLTNFALLYTLNPDVAAEMPAYWTPIPPPVAHAIRASSNGWVLYSDYASYFEQLNVCH